MKVIDNKSKQVEELIREKILSGEYALGSRIAAERTMGTLLGLSRCTIRGAMNRLCRERILVRKEGDGTFVTAEALKIIVAGNAMPVRGRVTLFLPPQQVYNPFYLHLVSHLVKQLAAGIVLNVSFKFCLFQAEEEASATDIKLVYGNYPKMDLLDFCARFNDVTVINRRLGTANYITTDNYKGGELICDYILKQGHRRIGCIHMASSSMDADDYNERLRGVRNSLEKHNCDFAAQASGADGMMKNYDCAPLVDSLLKRAPQLTAIICLNDALAISVYDSLRNRTLRIPEDISVIGFDDQYLTQFMSPPLTTAKVSIEEIAFILAEAINARIVDNRPLKIARELVPVLTERASVKTKS